MSLFSNVEPIRFEGPDTQNDYAYRVYDKDRLVRGNTAVPSGKSSGGR